MASELVVIYDTTTGNWIVKQAGAGQIADLAIVSGKLGVGAVISGSIASGQIGTFHIAPGAIVSSLVGANVLATPHIANQGILSASIGANALATAHIANQGLLSASFGALAVAGAHIANQGLLSSNYGANVIAAAHVANQGMLSSVYGVGSIGQSHVADYGLVSGKFASGAITESALASGISIDISETVQEPSFRAALSGILAAQAVIFTTSGYFDWARAAQSGRAPAVGLSLNAPNSGALGTLLAVGRVTNAGWNFSGYIGNVVYLGTSSQVVMSSPAASGNYVQRIGQAVGGQTIMLLPTPLVIQIGQ